PSRRSAAIQIARAGELARTPHVLGAHLGGQGCEPRRGEPSLALVGPLAFAGRRRPDVGGHEILRHGAPVFVGVRKRELRPHLPPSPPPPEAGSPPVPPASGLRRTTPAPAPAARPRRGRGPGARGADARLASHARPRAGAVETASRTPAAGRPLRWA